MTKIDSKIDSHVAQAQSILEELIARVVKTSRPELWTLRNSPACIVEPFGHRLILVSRPGLLCDCLCGSLTEHGFDVVFQPLNDTFIPQSAQPDLVVFNLNSYGSQAASAVHERLDEMRAVLPHVPVLALIEQADDEACRDITGLGVASVIVGIPSIKLVIAAIQLVILGGSLVTAEIRLRSDDETACDGTMTMVPPAEFSDNDGAAVTSCCFTRREAALLAHLRQGRQNKVIAHQLDISESTVKVHLRNIMRKLHASNRTQVVNILASIQQSGISRPSGFAVMPMSEGQKASILSKSPNAIPS